MATQIPRDKVIGNFKTPRNKRGHKQSNMAAERPGMSAEHLANIRRLPCCITLQSSNVQAHHLKSTGAKERGIGLRSTDRWAVPLNAEEHIYGVERVGSRNEIKWFADRGVDVLDLAVSLWMARGDFEKMHQIVINHRVLKT